ncbi:MAG TPA: MDR family MFS transporter, partial [Ktedonobacteraceae bacterium]|nr:MDR family MFS transporter [Ktedonobacteraceae bacterium]
MAQTQTASVAPASIPEYQPLSATLSRGRIFSILLGVILGMLLAALDQTIVGTALPHIVADLGGLDHYAWVVTAYLLASTVSIPIWGKLSDIYGRRTFFILGMVIFLIGSALAGTSQNMTQLIIYRGIQGVGAGAMMPIAMAIIGDIFSPAERGKWQGLIVAVFGLASIVGPTLGGWITDNWGWRWVFYVNMPVGVLAILTAGIVLPKIVIRRQHIIDYLGVVTLIAWTVPLLLAFSWAGTQYAWGSWQVIGSFIFAAVMLVTFVLVELRATEPIISPKLFKNSIFTISTIAMFLVSAGMFGAILYLPLFVQGVLGKSATNSGLVLTPLMLGFMFSSIVGGQLLSRTGRYKILAIIGFIVAAIGMFLLSRMTPATTQPELVRNMVVTGLGIGVMMSLFTIVVQNAFPYRQLGEVTASLTFFRSIGSTMGVAVMGTIMINGFQ